MSGHRGRATYRSSLSYDVRQVCLHWVTEKPRLSETWKGNWKIFYSQMKQKADVIQVTCINPYFWFSQWSKWVFVIRYICKGHSYHQDHGELLLTSAAHCFGILTCRNTMVDSQKSKNLVKHHRAVSIVNITCKSLWTKVSAQRMCYTLPNNTP